MVRVKLAEKLVEWFGDFASLLFFKLPAYAADVKKTVRDVKEKILGLFADCQENPRIPKALLMQTALRSYRHYEKIFVKKHNECITIPDADRVRGVFDQLQLPIPYRRNEFSAGCDGILIPLDAYGAMLRVEVKDKYAALTGDFRRINNSPWIVKPLASIDAGKFIVEICPGGFCEFTNEHSSTFLKQQLAKDGYSFFDNPLRNVGRLPLYSPDFPDGQPVVIDRLATIFCHSAENKLQALMPRFNPQDVIYSDLHEKFHAAWSDHSKPADPEKMRQFWQACAVAKAEGRLIAGWKQTKAKTTSSRSPDRFAQKVAAGIAAVGRTYDKRLQQMKSGRS